VWRSGNVKRGLASGKLVEKPNAPVTRGMRRSAQFQQICMLELQEAAA